MTTKSKFSFICIVNNSWTWLIRVILSLYDTLLDLNSSSIGKSFFRREVPTLLSLANVKPHPFIWKNPQHKQLQSYNFQKRGNFNSFFVPRKECFDPSTANKMFLYLFPSPKILLGGYFWILL